MTSPKPKTTQTMKPSTAAKKLGVPLSATPAEFQASVVSRDELNELQSTPPAWLVDLRRNGPHTKQVIAAKLKVSVAGLLRNGITEPLTTAEIDALKAENPEWLEREQALQVKVRKEALRLKQQG
ncbi:DUF5997 family protein [Streptosporangium sp. NPDC000239]|uniref:DUF5997 family protein n=1 Tax=Streptosporangium jomthongense TaxID=1193683 RepID=A0ABV8F4E6_9ACTN